MAHLLESHKRSAAVLVRPRLLATGMKRNDGLAARYSGEKSGAIIRAY